MFCWLVVTLLACIAFGPWVLFIIIPVWLVASIGKDIKKLAIFAKESPVVTLILFGGLWMWFSEPWKDETQQPIAVEQQAMTPEQLAAEKAAEAAIDSEINPSELDKALGKFEFVPGYHPMGYGVWAIDPYMVHAWFMNRLPNKYKDCNQLMASGITTVYTDVTNLDAQRVVAWCKDIKGNDKWWVFTNYAGVMLGHYEHPKVFTNPLNSKKLSEQPKWVDLYGTELERMGTGWDDIKDALKVINKELGEKVQTTPYE